ncbi:MAG: LysR family transcriptional regulator, partial [Pseudomonadota bacterium]
MDRNIEFADGMAMRNLDLDCLRTFLACADAPSFADAGARVHKSQSTVSVQMRRLEETLSRPIFIKRGRRNELTAAGRELREYAERMVRLNDEAVGRFDPQAFQARVRVGTPDDYAEVFLPGVFARFARANPGVEVAIECRTSLDLAAQIEAGELDLAVVTRDKTL